MTVSLPTDSASRKNIPLAAGLLDYFPAALAAVAAVSKAGNDKHNPGEAMHHARGKSMDHADCILRHLIDRGTLDAEDGLRHSAKVAWRALALLQEELEAAGAPLPRGARLTAAPIVPAGAWIDHDPAVSDEPLLPAAQAIDVMLRDGKVFVASVGSVWWGQRTGRDEPSDIVAYRILQTK